MAIFRRYAAMFRVGTSFIFSSIKSRSASVTLNLICTVLFRPSMCSLLSFPFRGFGTLPNKPFSTDEPQRGRAKIRKWVPASYACYECFYPLGSYPLLRRKSDFAKLTQKKNAAISKKDYNALYTLFSFDGHILSALCFDFRYLFCRCGHNPYACIAHTVKERVKLPPLRVLLRRRFQKELVYGYIVAEH